MFSSNTTQVSDGGYQISRSLRFNSADSASLTRTPATATNQKTWTWSGWMKRSALHANSTDPASFFNANGNGFIARFSYANPDKLEFYNYSSSAFQLQVVTTQLFRDVSAWYHVVFVLDTTQATSSNRFKLYVNGVQVTAFDTATYPSPNADMLINGTTTHAIGAMNGIGGYYNGYITDVNFIDGQALTPSSFGETNAQTGVWQPKAYSGSYGTNGFYLNFSDNSNTTAATLGKDYSGNGNNWTPNGFSVTAGAENDSLVDSPTSYGTDTGVGGTVRGNYATFNVLASPQLAGQYVISNGNLDITPTGASSTFNSYAPATIALPSSDKYYFEYTCTNADGGQRRDVIGLAQTTASGIWLGNTGSIGYDCFEGKVNNNGSNIATYASWDNGDIVSVAVDCATGYVWFAKNGTWQAGSPSAGTGATATLSNISTYAFAIGTRAAGSAGFTVKGSVNFGQRPFNYTAPSGFKALCTQNLPTPTIGATTATQAALYFTPTTYTGNGSASRAITNGINMSANGGLVWSKQRSGVESNFLIDNIRGSTKYLMSNSVAAENTISTLVTSFDSTGYSIGNDSGINANGSTYVSWVWGAGGSGSTNTAGSITSTVSANTTSGFSVVTYTGNSTNSTVGHGLGVAPSMIIVKVRNTTDGWFVYNKEIGNTKYLRLNTTDAAATFNLWQSTTPTSSVFSIATDPTVNGSGNTYVAYCFSEVAGYSKFGSYTGNGSADGPFVFTGFKPAFVMIKNTGAGEFWLMFDTARNTYNVTNNKLAANSTLAENDASIGDSTQNNFDFLSNGFKAVTTNSGTNGSGSVIIYMAFASNPFKYSLAR